MAGQAVVPQSSDSFEYMLFEGDPDHLEAVVATSIQISPMIDPSLLKLTHRIGRGPFGDVWIATHHQSSKDYDHYHEVAVKMLYPIKDDQIQIFLAKFDEMFSKYLGLEHVCYLHGISVQSGRICIAMKFYEGSIGDKMARLKTGRISLSDAIRYGIDLAQGILELHSRGIVILNLKPCNILLDAHDRAIVGDFGIPSLLRGLSLPSPDLVQRLGTPNYMAPEQWQPDIRGPISFETDSWGFGCSVVEMLSGIQPWRGKSPEEIYDLVVVKQERPIIPSGLPFEVENVLFGCFEYDFRRRPLIADILHVFKSCQDSGYHDGSWNGTGNQPSSVNYADWSLLKDYLQVGDAVRSRKPKDSCKPVRMEVPEGTVVGMESETTRDGFVLVRVLGYHDPLRVHSSTVERLNFGFAAGDCVRVREEDKKRSPVGILHSIDRDGTVTVGFLGMDTLWRGTYSELQMAESFCVGQFVTLKGNISTPRFEWPRNGKEWATGRISQVLSNGCLVVKFPGRFSFGDTPSSLADPAEVEAVDFSTCKGAVKKFQHLEDFHWSVRPSVIALGLFTALKLGFFVGKSDGKPKKKSSIHVPVLEEGLQQKQQPQQQPQKQQQQPQKQPQNQQQQKQQNGNSAWLPSSVAYILFGEGGSSAR